MIWRKAFLWMADYSDPNSLASRWRRKRAERLVDLIDLVRASKDEVNIIDVGGTKTYWSMIGADYLRENRVRITLVNLPGTIAPIEDEIFRSVDGDGCDLSAFEDGSFDIAHSNSVIEHVGTWQRMGEFAKEIKRVAANYFVQTPNFWFPIEPHFACPFFHWLPVATRAYLLTHFRFVDTAPEKSYSVAVQRIECTFLLNHKMFSLLFDDAEIHSEKWLGMSKSLIAVRKGNRQGLSGP